VRRKREEEEPMLKAARIAALGATLVLACASCAGSRAAPAKIEGRLASGGGYLGDWDFYPAACAVHDDEVVLVESQAGLSFTGMKRVRLVDRSRVPSARNAKIDVHVARETPTGPMDLIFTDPSCVKSALSAGPQGYAGKVSLDCTSGQGGHVVGEITFSGCR
jgi:hypothetical protein